MVGIPLHQLSVPKQKEIRVVIFPHNCDGTQPLFPTNLLRG